MTFLTKCKVFRVLECQVLNYSRWSHRQPKRVLSPEEFSQTESQYQDGMLPTNVQDKTSQRANKNFNFSKEITNDQWSKRGAAIEGLRNLSELETNSSLDTNDSILSSKKKKKQIYKTLKDVESKSKDMLETVIDSDGNLVYTKLPEKDPGLSQVLVTVKSHNHQEKKNLALLEGKRLIKEALEANCKLKSIIFSRKGDLEYLKPYLPKTGAKLYKIPYREIQMWSDLTTAPGIMGIFKIPEVEKFVPPTDSLEVIVICDNVREPGNLGAILRTALAVGVQSIILTKGCVDLWDTKVLRSACGAHFRLQIHRKMDWNAIKDQFENLKGSVLIADNKVITDMINEDVPDLQDTISKLPLLPYYSANFGELGTLLLIIGGETEGISGESYRFAAEYGGLRLNIPLSNNVDSLNTGTSLGVILFEIKRQLSLLKHVKELKTNIDCSQSH